MENALMSVVVLTYNSSRTILETLESIANQVYENIELIITDDCSTDDTCEICRSWIEQHKTRFVHSEIISHFCNTGLSANFNRGCSAASGVWIKPIAGDDLLCPDAINQFLKSVDNNKSQICYTFIQSFIDDNGKYKDSKIYPQESELDFYKLVCEQQLFQLLSCNKVYSPGLFVKKKLVESIPADERYRLLDDYPLAYHCSKKNVHLDFVPIVSSKYRISSNSIAHQKNFFPSGLLQYETLFFYNELYDELKSRNMGNEIKTWKKRFMLWHISEVLLNNNPSFINKIKYKFIKALLNA